MASKTVAIIQARMGSTRLPGKILKELAGVRALDHCVQRAQRCQHLDEIVIATTVLERDEVIVEMCAERGWPCTRGSEDDVLDRYYRAAVAREATVVVRVTSDCPLNDPSVIDGVVQRRVDTGADYVSTSLPAPTFPLGVTAEVMTFEALERAWRDDQNPAWREHVTPYIYRHPELFRLAGYSADDDHSAHRWTLDTAADYELLAKIFGHFGHNRFTWLEALAVVRANPEWQQINAHIVQKTLSEA